MSECRQKTYEAVPISRFGFCEAQIVPISRGPSNLLGHSTHQQRAAAGDVEEAADVHAQDGRREPLAG
jgi:hypothetical protein